MIIYLVITNLMLKLDVEIVKYYFIDLNIIDIDAKFTNNVPN